MTNIPLTAVAEKLKHERVMLVGGAGFIGHNVSLELRRMGVETMVVDNLMVNNVVDIVFDANRDKCQYQLYLNFLMDRFQAMRDTGVLLRNKDARLMQDMVPVFDEFQPTKVVHLAAISSAVNAPQDPGLCFDLQLVTLRNVLELCRINVDQVNQVMMMSSSTVYGDFENESVDETTRPRPKGIYSNTKYMAERLMRTYTYQLGLGTTIIRPSALYGERCVSRRVSQVFIENALTGKPLFLEGGGNGKLDFTYIKDFVNGVIRALAMNEPNVPQTYNITFGNSKTIADLANIVSRVIPNTIIEERPRAQDKPIRGTLCTDRARNNLGFKPEWSLEDGYTHYCEWYAEQWARAARRLTA